MFLMEFYSELMIVAEINFYKLHPFIFQNTFGCIAVTAISACIYLNFSQTFYHPYIIYHVCFRMLGFYWRFKYYENPTGVLLKFSFKIESQYN